MATFIKGVTDQLGPMQLYRPDYQFLTQVYGTKQAQYDRGFNMVKNLYNSVLNSQLTNANNENFRQEAFKKIQGSLKSMSNVDLSNSSNIMRASSLIDPISKDQDIAYDMYVTKFHGKQKELMETYKNSQDPKMRAMYNEYSRMDIGFAEEDLRNAKRGDGSIMKVQPREFVPFEDVNEYLRKAAKEDGLEIKTATPDGKGYIVERKNGMGVFPIYDNWATTVMGNRFDRQFAVMGRVGAESAIRNEMATKNLSREQATMNIAQKLIPELNVQHATEGITANKEYKKVEDEIKHFERMYPDGFPAAKPEIEKEYKNLLKAREDYKAGYDNARDMVARLQKEGPEYIASNLYGIYSQAAKRQQSMAFAKTQATKNQSEVYRPDTTWATKAGIASREKIAGAQLNMRREELQWDKQKTGMNNELKMLELQGKGLMANEQVTGVGVSNAPVYASDLNDAALNQNREDAYRSAFNGGNGLMKLVVNESANDFSRYYSAISKVKQIASGSQVKLTKEDVDNLNEYAEEKLGIKINAVPNDPSTAKSVLDGLASRTYIKATDKLAQYSKTYTKSKVNDYLASFRTGAGAFQNIVSQREQLNSDMQRINQEVLNSDGTVKELYKGAVIRGRLADGIYDIDVTRISEAGKDRLSGMVKGFKNQQNPASFNYSFSKLSPAELNALVKTPGKSTTITASDGSTLDMNTLKNLNTADLAELFGDRANVFYDAGKKQVRVELNVSQKESIGKTLGIKGAQSLYVNIPYETIQSSQGALSRMGKYIPGNTINSTSLGVLAAFMGNPDATVKGEAYKEKLGFDYSIQGVEMQDGSRKLLLTYNVFNPAKGKIEEGNPEYLDFTPNEPNSLIQAGARINQRFQNYLEGSKHYEQNMLQGK